MTNGENNMIDLEQFKKETTERVIKIIQDTFNSFFGIKKPSLTEDERVILRNIDNGFTKIRREHGELYSYNKFTGSEYDVPFNHLFQFIKDGEEYEIAELLKGE